MSGHGSHAILVLPIPFEVPNRPTATWIPVKKKKMPTTTNDYGRSGSISLKVAIINVY